MGQQLAAVSYLHEQMTLQLRSKGIDPEQAAMVAKEVREKMCGRQNPKTTWAAIELLSDRAQMQAVFNVDPPLQISDFMAASSGCTFIAFNGKEIHCTAVKYGYR
jgi:hypothetical protein